MLMTAHLKVRKNDLVEQKYNIINVNVISGSFGFLTTIDDLFSPMDSRRTALYKDRMVNDP